MLIGRNSHTSTLLTDGKVLICGGKNSSHQAINSVEIYDPVSEVFIPTSTMLTARHSHFATLLTNQKVLVTGGADAEIFDLASRTWAFSYPTDGQPGGDSATLLNDGQVLVIGGMDNAQKGIARLYNPSSNSWTRTGSLAVARKNHTATRLSDGRVLVCGGSSYATDGISALAEIYDPSSGTWTAANSLNSPRRGHTATLLPNNKVLVCGGNNRDSLSSTELFDPATGIWTLANPLSIPRDHHTAVLLPDNSVLVTGGIPIATTVLASSELYNPVTGNWTSTDTLASSRCLHAATRMASGDILITGGWGAYNRPLPGNFNLAISDAETYGPPVPEIALLENLTDHVSGSATDFGSVTLGNQVIRSFTLKNLGSALLSNLSLTIVGANFTSFVSTPSTLPPTLAAKSEISFTIRFTPSLAGPASASLNILSNDANEGNITVALNGLGLQPDLPDPPKFPEITVSDSKAKPLTDGKTTANFNKVKLRSTRSLTYTIRNTGNAELTGISITRAGKNQKEFSVRPLPKATLLPGEFTTFRVSFKPTATGKRNASLRILSNDADENPFDIVLTGSGIKP